MRGDPFFALLQYPQLLFGYETLPNNELYDESGIGHRVE